MMCAGRVEVKLRQSEMEEYERKLMEKEVEVGNLRKNLKQQQKLLQELKDHSQKRKIHPSSSDYQYAYMHLQCKNKMEEYELKQRVRKLQVENLSCKMQLAMSSSQKCALETEMQALIQEVATLKTAQAILEQKVLCSVNINCATILRLNYNCVHIIMYLEQTIQHPVLARNSGSCIGYYILSNSAVMKCNVYGKLGASTLVLTVCSRLFYQKRILSLQYS